MIAALDPSAAHVDASAIGRSAIAALHDELALDPKPGLVTPFDLGSHVDMSAATFFRSISALRGYFVDIAAAGARHAGFAELEELGIAAELRMLRATGGVNTHRGAVFSLGLLCAAAGAASWLDRRLAPVAIRAAAIRAALAHHWGDALRARADGAPGSLATTLARRHGLRSAGHEAATAFPTLFEHAWPAWQNARRSGLDERSCRLQAFFASMAVLDDTNLVHRGGMESLRDVRRAARTWLDTGGAFHPAAFERARGLRDAFVTRRLSPGGSADVLAATCWLARVTR